MRKEKKKNKAKLDEIKTDLEIKLVKMELKKLKEKENRLLDDDSVVEEKEDNVTKEENIVKKDNVTKEENVVKKDNVTKEVNIVKKDNVTKEVNIVKKDDVTKEENIVKKDNATKEDNFTGEVNKFEEEEDILEATIPEVEILISGAIEKKKVTVKKESAKKSISNKMNTIKSKLFKNSTIKKEKKSFFKEYKIIILVLLFIGVALTFRYIYQLKNELNAKEKELIEKEKEDIDYNPNGYFKDVKDDVNDNDLQDFNAYKDIPELVENQNTTKESSKNTNTESNLSTKNGELISTNNDDTSLDTNIADTDIELTNIEVKNDELKNDKLENEEKGNITVGYIKIVGLQYIKGDKYIIPKKVKKTDSFKIRIRLDKIKKSTINNKTEIVVVIKNAAEKTLKISKREIDFKNDKTVYLIFYEKFKYNLKPNEEYKISVFVNEKLITTTSKTIS